MLHIQSAVLVAEQLHGGSKQDFLIDSACIVVWLQSLPTLLATVIQV